MNNLTAVNINTFKILIFWTVLLASTTTLAFTQFIEPKPSKFKKCFHGNIYQPQSVCLGVIAGDLYCEVEFENSIEWLHVYGDPEHDNPEHDNPEECVVTHRPSRDLDCTVFDNPFDLYINGGGRS